LDLGPAAEIDELVADLRSELAGAPSRSGGFVAMSTADARRLLEGAQPSALARASFVQSAQRRERDVAVDTATLLGVLDEVRRHGTAQVPEEALRSEHRSGDPMEGGAARELGRRLVDPLEDDLTATRRLMVAAAGDLALVPFSALLDRSRRTLIERFELIALSSTFEVFDSPARQSDALGPALVIANPSFEDPTRPSNPVLAPLPEAEKEGKAVASLLGVALHLGHEAGDDLVRQAKRPAVIHLATHGFFAPDRRAPFELGGAPDATGVRGANALTLMPNPFDRAALAFAGAERWLLTGSGQPKPGDGVLLARDIASLDLRGTRLVVLSACETGVGQTGEGEATGSLGQAFRMAGAECVVMSLWSVPDEATRAMMEELYRGYLAGAPPPRALRAAQLMAQKRYPDSRAWPAFVCFGIGAMAS
jgi:CHAT domain-containing protein